MAQPLRPLERRLLRWRERGMPVEEMAERFKRSPGHIDRVFKMIEVKQRRS